MQIKKILRDRLALLTEQNKTMKEALCRILEESERYIDTSDDFWVFDMGLRMNLIITLDQVGRMGSTER